VQALKLDGFNTAIALTHHHMPNVPNWIDGDQKNLSLLVRIKTPYHFLLENALIAL